MPRHQKPNRIVIKDVNQSSKVKKVRRSLLSDSTNHHQKASAGANGCVIEKASRLLAHTSAIGGRTIAHTSVCTVAHHCTLLCVIVPNTETNTSVHYALCTNTSVRYALCTNTAQCYMQAPWWMTNYSAHFWRVNAHWTLHNDMWTDTIAHTLIC